MAYLLEIGIKKLFLQLFDGKKGKNSFLATHNEENSGFYRKLYVHRTSN
ncbi:hypothetical protein LEP1GSC058_0033 [Leptospira fainei serovar Hurstbridge str. BUT 6]|uniref:Uncharacterized protein n=1 Tax=Leptospira fainei serovar Hurstbridge str. BUT 6 TaxID=1193011 RepID=S3V398_9LEPT|nr:hypothetical protein LEP1GSC058_0033 [Leptospira fainei serovar Hurstbridge str. BUT 6]